MIGILIVSYFLFSFFQIWIKGGRVEPNLTQVAANEVCMLDDVYEAFNNYPSTINDSIYYCCEKDCIEHFQEPGFSTYAVDPISKMQVNKASAIYGRTKDNKILYFEKIENMRHYQYHVNHSKSFGSKHSH